LAVTFLLFWLGSKYFPGSVHIADQQTLILATIFMFVIGFLYGWLVFFSFMLIPLGIGCLTTIPIMIGAVLITPVKLIILNHYLTGFQVQGFWTYVIFTIALYMFMIKSKPAKKVQATS